MVRKKRFNVTWDEILAKAVAQGTSGTGAALSFFFGGSTATSILALVGLFLSLVTNDKRIRRMHQPYRIECAAPTYYSLREQLSDDRHVVAAMYSIATEPQMIVVVHPNETKFEQLLQQGRAKRVEEVLVEADNGDVIFVGGLPEYY